MTRPALWLAAVLTAIVAAASAPAHAQAVEATAKADTRLIEIRQLDPKGASVGTAHEVSCPSTGCQTIIDLTIAASPEPFLFSVEFVGRGAYVTLAPRSIAIAEVQEFGEGHKGAIFVPLHRRDRQQVEMAFIVVSSATVQALEANRSGDVLASGQVFNRKRYPDFTLRVTFSRPGS